MQWAPATTPHAPMLLNNPEKNIMKFILINMERSFRSLFQAVAFILPCSTNLAGAAVLNVPSQYGTIKAAYDACSSGDTILVANGTYTGDNNAHLFLTKSGTSGAPIKLQAASPHGAILDGQNAFYNNTGGTWIMNNDGSTVSYTTSSNLTSTDPGFVNNANDWHLQKCSSAIDQGITLTGVTSDYDGLPRPIGAGYDIGAYER